MGILESMRSGSDSTFMQVVMALLIFAFVGLYIPTGGDKLNTVATVNGEAIPDTEFNRVFGMRQRMVEAQTGATLSDAEQKMLHDQVREDLIEREVLLQEARALGIEVSDSEVARQLLQMPMLQGEGGRFSEELYARYLKQQRRARVDFEEEIREGLMLSKLQNLVYIGASTSEPAIREAWAEAGTTLELQTVAIRPASFDDELVITDEERKTWIAENGALVQETYDRDKARLYDHPEQIRLRMIRLAVRPEGPDVADLVPRLNKLRDRIAAGEDMAALAKAWSEDPSAFEGGDLGLRPVAQLSVDVSNAVSGLDAGSLSQVITTPTDVRLVRVEERVAPKVDELADVQDAIADKLMRNERLPRMAQTFAEDELLPKWKETGAVPDDLLAKHELAATSSGKLTLGQRNPFGPPQVVLDAARNAEVGAVLPEVYETGGTLYVAKLVAREEPDPAQFEAEKATIRETYLLARREAFFRDWMADTKARAKIE